MNTLKYDGGTKAEWLAMLASAGSDPQKIRKAHEALLWFSGQEQAEIVAGDERRFQSQLSETRKQFRIAQGIAFLAVVISILVWIFPRAARETSPTNSEVSQTPQSPITNTPTILLPVLTNSSTTTTNKTTQ
jgi:hypothetical protein